MKKQFDLLLGIRKFGKYLNRVDKYFWIYLFFAMGIRLLHYHQAMYFIYDVGRDLTAIRDIVSGHFRLVGPVMGLPGMFLGPLWYYLGVPGYLLSGGNPYGMQLWFICLSSLSLPLFWIVSHKLFGNTIWAKISSLVLAFIPGSINGTNFVWNPMLSLPLMTGSLLLFLKAKESKAAALAGYFLLALTLQSEFAYAIFFVATFWLLLPWLREKFEWKTMSAALLLLFVTILPQLGFEMRHQFSMTKSLLSSFTNEEAKVSQSYLWEHRPEQLFQTTKEFFNRSKKNDELLMSLIGLAIISGTIHIIIRGKKEWKIVLIMAVLPYAYYMFWRGNYGYFFDYYMTPHFIFITLLMMYGFQQLVKYFKTRPKKFIASLGLTSTLVLLSASSLDHLNSVIIDPDNNAGLQKMEQSIATLFNWGLNDGSSPAVFRIYTANVYTDHYDYLIWWLSKSKNLQHPLTVQQDNDTFRYILYEPSDDFSRKAYFQPWYEKVTDGFHLTRNEKVGVLTLETWSK